MRDDDEAIDAIKVYLPEALYHRLQIFMAFADEKTFADAVRMDFQRLDELEHDLRRLGIDEHAKHPRRPAAKSTGIDVRQILHLLRDRQNRLALLGTDANG